MDEILKSFPKVNMRRLERTLYNMVHLNRSYLFYKTDENESSSFHLYCSECKEHFNIAKSRGFKVSELDRCPKCVAVVTAKRYPAYINERTAKDMGYKFLYTHFIKGKGRAVYFNVYECEYRFLGNVSDEKIVINEVCKFYFNDGIAIKYKKEFLWGAHGWERKFYKQKNVNTHTWSSGSNMYWRSVIEHPKYSNEVDFKGTCLEHSIKGLTYTKAQDFKMEYLAFFVKNPNIELLEKAGYGFLVDSWVRGFKSEFRSIINTKASSLYKMFKVLNREEVKHFKSTDINVITTYQRLKGLAKTKEYNHLFFLVALSHSDIRRNHYQNIFEDMEKEMGVLKFIRYLHKQMEQSGNTFSTLMSDYKDYLSQMDRLRIENKNLMPKDFYEAHNRLSERIAELERRALLVEGFEENIRFRIIRRKFKHLNFTYKGLIIRPIHSLNELIREGEEQNHCVATYKTKHLKGERLILVIRKASNSTKAYATVEFDTKTNTIIQCRGQSNKDLKEELSYFTDSFIEKLTNKDKNIKIAG